MVIFIAIVVIFAIILAIAYLTIAYKLGVFKSGDKSTQKQEVIYRKIPMIERFIPVRLYADGEVVRRTIPVVAWIAYIVPFASMMLLLALSNLYFVIDFFEICFFVFISGYVTGRILLFADKKSGGKLGGVFSPLECGLIGIGGRSVHHWSKIVQEDISTIINIFGYAMFCGWVGFLIYLIVFFLMRGILMDIVRWGAFVVCGGIISAIFFGIRALLIAYP